MKRVHFTEQVHGSNEGLDDWLSEARCPCISMICYEVLELDICRAQFLTEQTRIS